MNVLTPAVARAMWIDRLESGQVPQAQSQLGTSNGARCCLGVLCDIAVEVGVIDSYDINFGTLDPYPDVIKMAGLNDDEGGYQSGWDNFDRPVYTSLVVNNDTDGKTFAEIADIVRAEPEGLFA
jgi:hypothetical protein